MNIRQRNELETRVKDTILKYVLKHVLKNKKDTFYELDDIDLLNLFHKHNPEYDTVKDRKEILRQFDYQLNLSITEVLSTEKSEKLIKEKRGVER